MRQAKDKNDVKFVFDFEDSAGRAARQRGFDGVICGHIHCAKRHAIGGVEYLKCGDWVDSCSATVEHFDGRMEVVLRFGSTRPARRAKKRSCHRSSPGGELLRA